MEQSDLDDFFIEHFVKDNILKDLIENERCLEKLCYYSKWQCRRIERNLAAKFDFKISKILRNSGSPIVKKEALIWGLTIQSSNAELIKCLEWFNMEVIYFLSDETTDEQLVELYWILEVFVKLEHIVFTDVLKYICLSDLKTFLLKLTNVKPNKEHYSNIYDTLMKYLDRMITIESNFMEETLNYAIQNESMDFLCTLFNRKLFELASNNLLENQVLWNSLNNHISKGSGIKKKQALSILSCTLEFIKNSSLSIPEILKSNSFEDWDFYLTLLSISEEKQLHLIKPTLKLLPSISSLNIMWRLSLYKVFLKHSQSFVIYETINFLLNLKFEDNDTYRELLKNILSALNQHDYSDYARVTYDKLSHFLAAFDANWCSIFFNEFLNINWNPIAAWYTLFSASSILHNIDYKFMKTMLKSLEKLPHPFIRSHCKFLFLSKVFEKAENLLLVTVEVGDVLLFSKTEVDVEIFEKLVKSYRHRFRENVLQENTFKAINNNNRKRILIYLKVLEILGILSIFPYNRNIPYSILDTLVLLDHHAMDSVRFTEYLLARSTKSQNDDMKYLSKIPDKFLTENKPITSEEYKEICNLFSKYLQTVSTTDNVLETISYNDLSIKLKSENAAKQYLKGLYIRNKWRMIVYKLSLKNLNDDEKIVIEDTFHAIFKTGDEKMFLLIVENLDILTEHLNQQKLRDLAFIYDECLARICAMPKPSLRIYAEIFFKATLHPNLFSKYLFVKYLNKWCFDLRMKHFSECVNVSIVILKKIRDLIPLKTPNLDILLPLSLSILLQGTVIQKTERIEYEVCQNMRSFSSSENPNIMTMELKMLAFETIFLFAKCYDVTTADEIVISLIDLYQKNYGKRYFPESKLHLEKLRIIQALLLIVRFVKDSKRRLRLFILDSFREETHQNSVKQLLQWLLILLMAPPETLEIEYLINMMTKDLEPSSIVYLVPVLYHVLSFSNSIDHWCKASDALLAWTMGANFKLRIYSQSTLEMLLRLAERKNLTEYLTKYTFLLKPITQVIVSTRNAAAETLKIDLAFIVCFDPTSDYCVENIFKTLPQVDAPPSEWKNITEYEFSSEFNMRIKNKADLSSFQRLNVKSVKTDVDTIGMNIQKKIIPWKYALEECVNNGNLGDLIVVASLLEKPSNLGGLSRTCEVFSVKQFVLHNVKIKDEKEFKSLSMSSENWVNFVEVKRDDLSDFLTNMIRLGYSLIGLEQTLESSKLNEYKFEKKTVLLLGNEKEGIPATLLPLMAACVEIPQFGQTRSLNVHVAAATCIWEYVRQHSFSS